MGACLNASQDSKRFTALEAVHRPWGYATRRLRRSDGSNRDAFMS
jgi:hypothetical protein